MRIWCVYPSKCSYSSNTMIRPSSFIAPDNAKLLHFYIKFTIVGEKSPYNHLIIIIVIIFSVLYILCKKKKKYISPLHRARGHQIVKISAGPTDTTIIIVLSNSDCSLTFVRQQNYVHWTWGSVGTNYIFYL